MALWLTQILSAISSNSEVKVVEDRDLGRIPVYPPQPKEFTVKIIARIMYPDDQYLEKISTVMVGGAGVTIESDEIRNSLILATLKVAPGASGGRFSITYENEDNPNHKGCNVRLLPVEVVELSPKVKDEDDKEIAGSEKPNIGKPLTPFVEIDPYTNRIAHRELKVKIGETLKGKKVTWTFEALPGATPSTIRGEWKDSPTHKDRFEKSTAYGVNGFERVSQTSGKTTIAADGHTAIRVNVPPIGFNQIRIKIQIEGIDTPIDLIDMEVPGIIVLDAGHGSGRGEINGSNAIGTTAPISKVQEHEVAFAISKSIVTHLKDKLSKVHNIKVYNTRKYSNNIGFSSRTSVARDNGADVLISLHFNSPGVNKETGKINTTLRHPFYLVDNTNNVNRDEDVKLGVEVRAAVQASIARVESAEGKKYLAHKNTSEKHEEYNNKPTKGLDILIDADEKNSTYIVTGLGNDKDYHPCRAALIELEWFSHPAADALFNIDSSGEINSVPGGRDQIRGDLAKTMSEAIFNNILNYEEQE